MLSSMYYTLKPFLPWRFRLALRRWRAARHRKAFSQVWPIDPSAGAIPPGWPGWPDEKQFAFVLTHDVEGEKGFSRIEQLIDLDRKYGFRSCFNLVPRGEYSIDPGILSRIDRMECETGVHGLQHDGKLYRSRKQFPFSAKEIRHYLQSWNASGFRSPLMQHRLGWIHEIQSQYDGSTFDIDPFEPQPDGMETIFPFWVKSRKTHGYVELPYTLVQDFTLFKVLGETSIEVWKQKLDWIVERGGMALINTHPDYMCFDGEAAQDEYPVTCYEELLRYVRERYGDACWHALPKEVSRFYCDKLPEASRNTRRKICMLAYTDYESDNRVRRYAESLAARGDKVDVIALYSPHATHEKTELNGVTIYHIQKRTYTESSHWNYASCLIRFFFKSLLKLTRLHSVHRYDVVHVHNMPDFLVFAALYPKMTGARLILDIHDIVPELFENKFKTSLKRAYFAALVTVERLSVRFVDHVIISNHLWREKLVARSVDGNRCSVFVNHVDPKIFKRRERTRDDRRYIVLFPGSFQWHQGLDIGIRAFAEFKKWVPGAEFHLYGNGSEKMERSLKELVRELALDDSVKFCGSAVLDDIVDVIANADLGVVPKRADSFGNEAYSTKIMEFMSQGIPVVVSRTKIDSYYFDDDVVRFFPSGDVSSMAQAMYEIASDANIRASLVERGLEYADRHGWGRKKQEYLDLVDDLATETFDDLQLKCELDSAVAR